MAFSSPASAGADPIASLLGGLQQFRQIILYGAPGTGKTLLAQRLALNLLADSSPVPGSTGLTMLPSMGALSSSESQRFEDLQKDGRAALLVLHPAYGYEQFVIHVSSVSEPASSSSSEKVVRAFKCMHCSKLNKVRLPGGSHATSQKLERGVFWKMCKHAEKKPAVLILDEINRVDLASLFGDLLYALEYRERPVLLPFEYREAVDGKKTRSFKVPKNLYVIGTMNSADRSLRPMDLVMKRRFGMFQVEPDTEVVKNFWQNRDPKLGRQLVTLMKRMNDALARKDPTGDLRVGHGYFLADPDLRDPLELHKQAARKWEHQVHQLLVEYDRQLGMGPDFFKRFPKRFE